MSKSSKSFEINPLGVAISAAFAASLAASPAIADENPFGMTDLDSGYMVAHHHEAHAKDTGGKNGKHAAGHHDPDSMEGKYGEGRCGEMHGDGHHGKSMEGKHGEGACGGHKDGDHEYKSMEGKCGEGACGGRKDDHEKESDEGSEMDEGASGEGASTTRG